MSQARTYDLITGTALAREPRRVPFSTRVDRRDKEVFSAAAKRCGLDPATIMRCMMELAVERIDKGEELLAILREFKDGARTIDARDKE